MKSFHQRTILQRVDCLLVYTEDQQKTFAQMNPTVFTLKSPPKEVAAVLRTANSIYIHPDGFDYWIDILQVLNDQKPLEIKLFIFAGSDYSITDEHMEFWGQVFPKARFWIQNYIGSLSSCRIFPIGVNLSLEMKEQEKKQQIVISYFNPLNSQERSQLNTFIQSEESLKQYHLPSLGLEEYLQKVASAYFSVCPQGNGYDSIRFWESLSVGAIPLVLSSPYVEALLEQHPELPFMILQQWEDLPSFVKGDMHKVYDMYMEMSNLEMVTEEYWQKEFTRIVGTSDGIDLSNTTTEASPSEQQTAQASLPANPV